MVLWGHMGAQAVYGVEGLPGDMGCYEAGGLRWGQAGCGVIWGCGNQGHP